MAVSEIGYHIDKEDLQRMLKDNGAKTKKAEEKKPLTPSKIALIAIEIIVAVAYFVLVIMDRFFMEEENFIIQSLEGKQCLDSIITRPPRWSSAKARKHRLPPWSGSSAAKRS